MTTRFNITDPFADMCNYGVSSSSSIVAQFPSRKYVINQIFYCFANSMLIIPTVLLNGISVLTIWKSSHLKAKFCYFLILIQSIVDLTVGLVSIPLNVARGVMELYGVADCVNAFVLQAIAYIPVGTSFMTIYLLTFERYLSILHPILHRSYVAKSQMLVYLCCAGVVVSVTGPVFRVVSEKLHSTFNTATVLVLLVFNTFAYARIYFAVRHMHFSNDSIGDYSTEQRSSNMVKKRKSLRERSLAKSCALVVLISYFCYIPFVISYVFFKDDQINFRVTITWSSTVFTLNSSLNSIVFFWKRPLLREEALKILRKIIIFEM